MRRVLAMLAVLGLTQCNSPPPVPPAQPVVVAPVVPAQASVAAVAPPPVAPPAKPKAPEPPPLRLVAAGAVIVWTEDAKARGGFRSALVEPAPGGGARVIAERPAVIMASSKDLWVLRIKKGRAVGCAECDKCFTDPPTCTKNSVTAVDEPYLQSLRTNRVLEPWSDAFVPSTGCADAMSMQEGSVALAGAVGTVIFASVGKFMMGCRAAHPASESGTLVFDLDTETALKPTFPAPPLDDLVERAHKELTAQDCANPDDRPEPWEASAAYGAGGELHGVYSFTMAAPYYCGTGPGHYSILSEQTSPWLPPELAAYGKLPAFAAKYMAEQKATFAMPIAPARVADAEKEMGKH